MHLQGGHVVHQGAQGAARHGVAHGHVDVFDALRQGIQHRDQQALVRQDDGRLDAARAHPVQDGRDLLGLAHARGDTQDVDLRLAEALRVGFEGLGEFGDVVCEELGGLVVRIADPFAAEVPAELRQMRLVQAAHQPLLAFVEGVQPDEDEFLHLRETLRHQVRGGRVLQALGQLAVDLALRGHALFAQPRVEIAVERQQQVPDAPEGVLVFAARVEMLQELADGRFLRLVQVVEAVLDAAEVGDVGEELLGIDEVLVHVGEVRQQHAAPEDEVVERLRLRSVALVERLVAVIKLEQQVHLVRLAGVREAVEEVVHRVQGRHAHRLLPPGDAFAQVLAEERHRAPVREDEAQVFNPSGGLVVPRHLIEERSHYSSPRNIGSQAGSRMGFWSSIFRTSAGTNCFSTTRRNMYSLNHSSVMMMLPW